MKKKYSSLLFVLYIVCFLFYTPSFAFAVESVEAFENNVRATWHNSGDRVSQLQAEKAKIVGQEDNFASLYGVKKSDIYRYVAGMDFAINNYIQIKEEIKNNAVRLASTTSLEHMLKNTTEENEFKLFFDFSQAYARFSQLLKDAVRDKTRIAKLLDDNEKELSILENAYRVTGEAANYDSSQFTKQAFDFIVARKELENFLIVEHFAQLHLSTLDQTIKNYEKTIAKIESLSKEMLKGIDKDSLDASFLDRQIEKVSSYYTSTYNSLRDDTVFGLTQEELLLLPKEFAKLLQNTAQTEKKYLLTAYDEWLYFLPYWYLLIDVYYGDKPISVTEDILEQIEFFNNHTDSLLMDQLFDLYAVISKIEGAGLKEDAPIEPKYKEITLKLEKNIALLKQRYLTYVKLHALLREQNEMIENSIQLLHKKSGDKALKTSLRKKHISDLMHFEIFNVANRSITIRKVANTLLIVLYAYLIVFLLKKIIRKLQIRKQRRGIGNYLTRKRLILEKTVAIAVYVLAFFSVLTELNIPLTAFAYMGGIGAVAIGFGAQTIFANLFSGLILIYGDKIRIGDWVIVDGTLGRVEDITAQNTIIAYDCFTQHMIVPNSLMLKDTVRNVTRADGLVGDDFEVVIEDVHDLNRGIAAIYRKRESIKELLPNYFFAVWSGEISGVAKLRPSIIISYTYDVRLITAGKFKAIMRQAVYDALIEEGIYDSKELNN